MLFGHGAGMSDYLTNLLIRTRYPERTIQPRLSSMFDPVSPGSMGGEVQGWFPGEELYPAVQGNQRGARHDLSARRSPEATGQDREDGGPVLERETQQQERGLESSTVLDLRDSSSETIALSEPKDVASELTPVLDQVRTKPRDDRDIPSRHPVVPLPENGTRQPAHASASEIVVGRDEVTTQVAPSRLDDEQRRATARDSSEDKPVSLSPIDPSIVGQAGTAPVHKPTAQSANLPLRLPSDKEKGSASGRTVPLIERFANERSSACLTGVASQSRDREVSNNAGTYGADVGTPSSQHSLDGVPTRPGDGEAKRPILASRKVASGERSDLSEIAVDPSLVSPASAVKTGLTSRPLTSRRPGNPPAAPSSPADTEEVAVSSLAVPMASKRLVAERRVASPMTAATVSHASVTDRGKPAEPVVQVTIGRVEVRAVSAPVRQEKGRKPQSAMSLDDYLKRRGGRSGG